MQHLPPKGSKGIIGANALPGVFMDNQPDAILRSYLCPSVAGGNSVPKGEDCYRSIRSLWVSSPRCLLFTVLPREQTWLPATITNVVFGAWRFWEPSRRTGAIPLDFVCWATREIQPELIWHLLPLAFAHLLPQLSSYPYQPASKPPQIAWANSQRAFVRTFAISELAPVLARGRQILPGD